MTAWARSSLHLIIFAWVYCGSKSSFFSMGPHNFSLTRLPAIIDFYWWIHTETTGDYFGICFPFFQGQKPGLTDVQAELDRMTRKQDSMVSANNVPPPTQNEAWRQRKRLHRPLHWYSGTVHVHLSRKNWPKSQRLSHRTQWFHQNHFRMLSNILVFWWEEGVWKF